MNKGSEGRFTAVGRWAVTALVLAWGVAGCAALRPAGAGQEGRTVWESRDQFVRVVPREDGAEGGRTADARQATVTAPDLQRLFGSIRFVPREGGAPGPLFTATELAVLGEEVGKGLGQARSDEEVTFAVFGYYPVLHGLAKETRVTTGRVFLQDGELNLILGQVREDVNDRDDRRLFPFVPGSRQKVAHLPGRIETSGASYTLKRADCLVFRDLTAGRASTPEPAVLPAPPAGPPGSAPSHERKPSIEERLMRLDGLKEKGLITDEEYRQKRRAILDEL